MNLIYVFGLPFLCQIMFYPVACVDDGLKTEVKSIANERNKIPKTLDAGKKLNSDTNGTSTKLTNVEKPNLNKKADDKTAVSTSNNNTDSLSKSNKAPPNSTTMTIEEMLLAELKAADEKGEESTTWKHPIFIPPVTWKPEPPPQDFNYVVKNTLGLLVRVGGTLACVVDKGLKWFGMSQGVCDDTRKN